MPITVVFDKFSQGEFGLLAPIHHGNYYRGALVGGQIADSPWTGNGIVVLPDGSLCPRPDPKAQSTSMPALAGAMVDMGMGASASNPVIWFKAGNRTYQSNSGPWTGLYGFAQNTGTSGNTASYIDRCASGTSTFAVRSDNVLEVIDHAAGSVAAVGGTPPACTCVAQFNDRLMLAGSGANANRLYFSAAGNFASWPVANFIDVGDSSAIVALVPMRGFLLIAKGGSVDDTWWVLRGVPGVNAVLRRASRFPAPPEANGVALLNDNRVGYSVASFTNGSTGSNGAPTTRTPAFFDSVAGSLALPMSGVLNANTSAATEAFRMANSNDMLFRQQTQMLLRVGNTWAKHALPSTLFTDITHFSTKSRAMAADALGATFSMVNADGATNGYTFYAWHPYATRPAFSADVDGVLGSSASVTLPEWRAPFGEEVSVAAIVVAFTKWNTGDVDHPNFLQVTVTPTGPYPDGLSGSTANATWQEAASASSTSGTLARETFTFAPAWGNGFQVGFSVLRGVAVRSVAVVCDVRPAQGLP